MSNLRGPFVVEEFSLGDYEIRSVDGKVVCEVSGEWSRELGDTINDTATRARADQVCAALNVVHYLKQS